MSEERLELQGISDKKLTIAKKKELDSLIQAHIQESKNNYREMEQLALESVALLTSAEAHAQGLSNQKPVARFINNFTGKNDKIRTSIAKDTAAAQYTAQQTFNYILKECTRNQELALSINDRLNECVLALETQICEVDSVLAQTRDLIVMIYNDHNQKLEAQGSRLSDMEKAQNIVCPYCNHKLKLSQLICPRCGDVHPLKEIKLSPKEKKSIQKLANCVKDESWTPEIYWSEVATSYAKKIHKAQKVAQHTNMNINESLQEDIQALIEKCRSAEFQIAVVGILKAGKSMLMNALIGLELAPTGLNSTTAALTKFRSSPQGHYVKVKFHSQEEWKKLTYSVNRSGKSNQSGEEDAFLSKLNSPEVKNQTLKWVGHEAIQEYFDDISAFRDAIVRWAAADSAEHLFVSELEVGIDKELFDMPEEVVFVDTPGLEDPVKYRSEITKSYIKQANAVLVAIRPMALTVEGFKTITTVLDYTGGNKGKVFLVGTQKDTLNKADDYTDLIEGNGGWIEQLLKAGRYKNVRELKQQIFTTSAYLHLCMNKMSRLSDDELNDSAIFSDDEYNNLEGGVKKALNKRSYSIETLRHDSKAADSVYEYFGVSILQKHIERTLIQNYRQLKVKDIATEFERCKSQLQHIANESVKSEKERVEAARLGAADLKKGKENKDKALKNLKEEKGEIEGVLGLLKQITEEQLESVKKVSVSKKGGRG